VSPAPKKRASAAKPSAGKALHAAPATKPRPLPGSKAGASGPSPKARRSLDEFMAQAWAMEMEAAQRYSDFADAMETHNNLEVAAMFRTMAQYENRHALQILAEMGWTEPPVAPGSGFAWPSFEAPETAPIDDVHYLMQPWHALQLALAAEERAERFFGELAHAATNESVRRAARELQAEEREHVALVKAWIKKVAKPDPDWAHDFDPARYTD
jgi:rubrerythrin